MQKLQIFVINSRSGKQLGLIRNPIHLLGLLKEGEDGYILTPPLPSWDAYGRLEVLKEQLHGKLGHFHWFVRALTRNMERVLHDSGNTQVIPDGLIHALHSITKGRLAAEERIMTELRQQGYWPADISRAVDQSVFRSSLVQFPGIRRSSWGIEVCTRCNSRNIVKRPCIKCGLQDCPVCIECSVIGENRGCSTWITCPVEAENGVERRDIPFHLDYELTKAQQHASYELVQFVQGRQRRALVWAACGAGKTEVTFGAIRHVLGKGGQVLFAIPRLDIVRELAQRCARAFPGLEIAVHHGGQSWLAHGDLVVATTHQVLHFYRRFDLVILDEVDAFPYHGSEMLRFGVERAAAVHGKLVEMTATPTTIPKTIPVITIPARYHGFPLPEPEIPKVQLPPWEKLESSSLPSIVVDILKDRREPWIVFAPTIEACGRIQQAVTDLTGIEVGICHSKEPQRQETIERFRRGCLEVVVATSVLERGVTFPRVNVMVLYADHPLFSSSTLVQMAGRVGRTKEFPNGQVWFLGSRITPQMRKACRMIQQLNWEAEERGLLRGEGDA